MSDESKYTPDIQPLDIFARRVLAKAILPHEQIVFQENYSSATAVPPNQPLGTKGPLKLYVVNKPAVETGPVGIPVKCVKLCRRIIDPGYPKNTIICTQKSKVTIDFELILIVEFEDNSFEVLTLPKDISPLDGPFAVTDILKAFVDLTVLSFINGPIVQNQNKVIPYETFVIKRPAGVNTAFEYNVSIPMTSFDAPLRRCELEDPSLQSYILLRNLKYEVDVLEPVLLTISVGGIPTPVWTTEVHFSLFEDIIDKLGIDQDIQICGNPEFVCADNDCP